MGDVNERLSGYGSPEDAPEPTPFTPKSIGRCTVNRITTAGEAYGDNLPATVAADEPFWDLQYESLDARWSDGPHMVRGGTKLFDKNGVKLDKRQRPHQNSLAFAALGIIAWPLDPNYNESRVVGNVFNLEGIPMEFPEGSFHSVPRVELGPDFKYTGEVRVIESKRGEADGSGASVAPAAAPSIELTTDEAATVRLNEALDGCDRSDENALSAALKTSGLTNATLNGERLFGLLVNGTLVQDLTAAGIIA